MKVSSRMESIMAKANTHGNQEIFIKEIMRKGRRADMESTKVWTGLDIKETGHMASDTEKEFRYLRQESEHSCTSRWEQDYLFQLMFDIPNLLFNTNVCL
jgi:hypothetical protein